MTAFTRVARVTPICAKNNLLRRLITEGNTMSNPDFKKAVSIHEFTVKDLNGQDVKLDKYKGHVCIIVNVASKCGLTGNNYKEFNEMYDKYAESKGLRILAFPCNQFANEEPGNSEEISCSIAERKVKFDVFEKVNVNGLRILAFPCNQFANQEPGGAEEIACSISERKVKFDIFEKVNVNGNDAHPLWKFLKHKQGGTIVDMIKWNFTKFIVNKEGLPVDRFGPNTDPHKLVPTLEKFW